MRNRLLAPLCRRFGWARTAAAMLDRFDEVHGNQLTAVISMQAFLSLFPLLLVAIAVVGFVSHASADLPQRVIDQLQLTGSAADTVTSALANASRTAKAASIVGLAGLLWTGLALVAAMQFAFDSVWQVSGRGLVDKALGLAWLAGAGVTFAASMAVTALAGFLPGPLSGLSFAVTLPPDVLLWLFTFNVLTNRRLGWRAFLPGAVLGGIGIEVLKLVGAVYVPRLVASSSALYGSLGGVFALLAWLLFFGRLTVYAAVLNVVRWEEVHGTVTVEVEVPSVPGEVPLAATRAGEAGRP